MPKRAALFIAAALLLFALARTRQTISAQAPPPPAMGFFVTLGIRAAAVEKWDGSAQVSNGTLDPIEGWHFSQGDAITGHQWKCVTRRDAVAPFADVHYTEMRPGEIPPVLFHPVGVFLAVRGPATARVFVQTAQGNFQFTPGDIGPDPAPFLNGRATVARVPAAEKLSDAQFEDDEPSIAALPDGSVAVAWVAYKDRADRILFRTQSHGAWTAPEEVSPKPAEIFRTSLAADSAGNLWLFWSERENDRWNIWSRVRRNGAWQPAERLTSAGSSTFHRAAAANGAVFVAYQSYNGRQADIYLKAFTNGAWSQPMRLSESSANDWEPAIAAAPDGSAHIAWDSYDAGNYDIHFRSWKDGKLSPLRKVTSSAKFQAHAAVAVDAENRPWVAWDESGVNWAKDQGFLIPTPLATPIHQQRAVRLAAWDGSRWMTPAPAQQPLEAFPPAMRQNAEHPQIVFDGGALTLLFRHWTRRNDRTIGSPIMWENYLTRFDGEKWSAPRPLPSSAASIEKNPALARDAQGGVWAAWMTDGRPFSTMAPANADVYCARLGQTAGGAAAKNLQPFVDAPLEAIPIHVTESQDVQSIRGYSIKQAGKEYKIYRGDMHRHTDVSQDFKYDGSLLELYRYAMDAAAFDYIAATDHQAGYDQEFTWWQNQKLVDLFFVPGAFTPLYAYERSVPYPNGHRNVIFSHPGVRTLPIPPEEMAGSTGAARLYEYLKKNDGISMPHSSATSQGTDWRDNDAVVEPLVEIYQGYRNSYEYEGAPRSATELNPQAQKSGWEPAGFWWKALAKGYKLGVQASSDHWSTHISYACLLAESFTREGLVDAIRKRHAYGATDNIILDFSAGGHIMGDAFASQTAPHFSFTALGTGTIQQIDLIKNRKFVYTAHPGTRRASFEFTDRDFGAGESYYYVRVLQQDGQLAWSSPMWVRR